MYLEVYLIIAIVLAVANLIQSLLLTKLRLNNIRLLKENQELRRGASDARKLE